MNHSILESFPTQLDKAFSETSFGQLPEEFKTLGQKFAQKQSDDVQNDLDEQSGQSQKLKSYQMSKEPSDQESGPEQMEQEATSIPQSQMPCQEQQTIHQNSLIDKQENNQKEKDKITILQSQMPCQEHQKIHQNSLLDQKENNQTEKDKIYKTNSDKKLRQFKRIKEELKFIQGFKDPKQYFKILKQRNKQSISEENKQQQKQKYKDLKKLEKQQYALDHSNKKIKFPEFIQTKWTNLVILDLTGAFRFIDHRETNPSWQRICRRNEYQPYNSNRLLRMFMWSSDQFEQLQVLLLDQNKLTEIAFQGFIDFKKLTHLSVRQSNKQNTINVQNINQLSEVSLISLRDFRNEKGQNMKIVYQYHEIHTFDRPT